MRNARYEVDPHNRLVINNAGKKSDLPKFRKILDGRFKTDEDNNLSYHVKAPLSEDEKIPHQIKIKGEWSLTGGHELRLSLDKSGRETFGDEITLQGEILDVNENSLLFAVTAITKEKTQSTYILNLGGSWKAGGDNRISFHVRREKGRYDILTLNCAWQINKKLQIIYRYEKAGLITKKRRAHTLTFKGYWDIKEKGRISYVLGGGPDNLFDFKASAAIFKEESIRYEVGIGLTNRSRPMTQTVTLFGRWNLKRGVGLIFEVKYEEGERAMVFGIDARLTDKDTISFRLKNDVDNRDVGGNLELSHKMLKGDGEAFLRMLKSRGESAIAAGAAWRW